MKQTQYSLGTRKGYRTVDEFKVMIDWFITGDAIDNFDFSSVFGEASSYSLAKKRGSCELGNGTAM